MEIRTLYRYVREDGGVTVSTEKPEVAYIERFRLIADDGKAVTNNGEDLFSCIDVESVEGYYEVDMPEEEEIEE